MCGRFTRNYHWAQIHAMYSLVSSASNLQPRFNICPTTDVDVVIRGEGPRALVPMRWGLIPGWWEKPLKEGLREVVWVFLATSERWKHACEHLEPQIFLVAYSPLRTLSSASPRWRMM